MTKPLHELPNTELFNRIYGVYQQLGLSAIQPVLLEVGAAHPESISVSFPFRSLGWKIISVEANPEFCADFRKRKFDILQYAACDKDIGFTTFKISPNYVCSSGLEIKDIGNFGWTEDDFKTVTVQAYTLNKILKRHHPNLSKIDVLIIDVEGYELEVLRGLDVELFQPKVICIENVNSSLDYRKYMDSLGFEMKLKKEQDEIYTKIVTNSA